MGHASESGPAFWPYEFPNAQGSPHWCGDEYRKTGQYVDFCPYVNKGPNAGKYRHPHIAFAALQQHLAHLAMPVKCGTEWDDRGNYPMKPDTSWAWVQMVDDSDPKSQPAVPYKPNKNVRKDIPGQILRVSGNAPDTTTLPPAVVSPAVIAVVIGSVVLVLVGVTVAIIFVFKKIRKARQFNLPDEDIR